MENAKTNANKASELLKESFLSLSLRKAVFSKPEDRGLVSAVAVSKLIGGRTALQLEIFHSDNKATHKNLFFADDGSDAELEKMFASFRQVNIMTTAGDCEYRRSASGNDVLLGGDKLRTSLGKAHEKLSPAANNKEKNHILRGDEPFLIALGISDERGRPHDKKLPKLRQINRFLEYVRDIEKYLPKEGTLHICDLCCGKSYLSFAVYHYFANIRRRDVKMTGADLKADVIEYCNSVAASLGFTGLSFICTDVKLFCPDTLPALVVSLHACDTATDIVLEKGAGWRAPVILSTPCCHHYMNHNIDCPCLSFISEHSMLRQKFCDAATDALRAKKLEAEGYSVDAVELVDPDDTPKNILLRAVLRGGPDEAAKKEYLAAYSFLYGKKE